MPIDIIAILVAIDAAANLYRNAEDLGNNSPSATETSSCPAIRVQAQTEPAYAEFLIGQDLYAFLNDRINNMMDTVYIESAEMGIRVFGSTQMAVPCVTFGYGDGARATFQVVPDFYTYCINHPPA